MYSGPEEMVRLTQVEVEDLMRILNVYPSQMGKFRLMIKSLSNHEYKNRSNTAIFHPISPLSMPNHRNSLVESTRYVPLEPEKQETNTKLRQELQQAQAKIASLEKEIKKKSEIGLTECVNNKKIDKNAIGKSFDSSRMRSTLHNMDIEEVCRCFARIIQTQCEKKPKSVNAVIKEFNSVLSDENSDLPEENLIYYWVRNIIAKGKLDKDAVVKAIVYLERYMEKTAISVSPETWKKLVFVCLLLAGKGGYVAKEIYEFYDFEEVERLERAVLVLIEFNLTIKQSEYAHAYFLLRTYSSSKDKSAPTKFLQVSKVLDLQKNIIPESIPKQSLLKSM
jgi:hypothetical protein